MVPRKHIQIRMASMTIVYQYQYKNLAARNVDYVKLWDRSAYSACLLTPNMGLSLCVLIYSSLHCITPQLEVSVLWPLLMKQCLVSEVAPILSHTGNTLNCVNVRCEISRESRIMHSTSTDKQFCSLF